MSVRLQKKARYNNARCGDKHKSIISVYKWFEEKQYRKSKRDLQTPNGQNECLSVISVLIKILKHPTHFHC